MIGIKPAPILLRAQTGGSAAELFEQVKARLEPARPSSRKFLGIICRTIATYCAMSTALRREWRCKGSFAPYSTPSRKGPMLDIALQPKPLELARLMEAVGPNVATWLGFGGALGGAKSGAIRRIMLARRGKYPKTIGVIMRRVLADVKENHIQKFWEEFPELRRYYNATDFEIVLPNGSRIKFMYAENTQEVDRKFYGPEFFDIFIDQAEQFSERELRTINTRNRAPGPPDGLCKMGLFFNPGGCGTEFLRRVFWLKQYHDYERASDYAFIQSYGWDNYEWLRGTGVISEPEYYALPDPQRFQLFIERSPYGRKLNELPPSIRAGLCQERALCSAMLCQR
jgi:Phage terminase large subunit